MENFTHTLERMKIVLTDFNETSQHQAVAFTISVFIILFTTITLICPWWFSVAVIVWFSFTAYIRYNRFIAIDKESNTNE